MSNPTTNNSGSSNHYYVAVPADGNIPSHHTHTHTHTQRRPASGGSPRVVRTKKRCLGLSSGCLCLLLLGLLLFFLVPRRPIVRYQSSTLSLNETTSSVMLTQVFSYYNPNYYTVQWKNLHVEVEDKSSQTPLGYGWHNVSFPVGALESRSVGVDITITAAFSNLAPLIKAQCNAQGFVTFASYGTVDAWIWSQNFGSIRIGPFEEVIGCGAPVLQRGRGRRS